MEKVKHFCFEFMELNAWGIGYSSLVEDLKKEMQKYRYTRINFNEFIQIDDFKTLSNDELTACILNLDRSQVEES